MTFQRSPSALGSIHLFFQVDVVAFCEGGPSQNIDEALTASVSGRTLDAMYWANLVQLQSLTKKYHFKSVGCKETLLKISSQISEIGCSSATVCLDADYDFIIGVNKNCSRIAYTYGYSWESDVLHRPVIERIMINLTGPLSEETKVELNRLISKLEDAIAPWCEVDISLKARAKPCVFDRNRHLSVVDLSSDYPRLNTTVLQQRLVSAGYSRKPRRIVRLSAESAFRIAFGKLTSKLIYHTIVKLGTKIMENLKIDYYNFMKIAMSETFSLLRSGEIHDLASHMNKQSSAFA